MEGIEMKAPSPSGVLVLLLLVAPFAFAQSAIDGDWVGSLMGSSITYTLKAGPDSTLTGSVSGQQGTTEIREGKIDGNKVSFLVDGEWEGQKFVTSYEGVLDGDQLELTLWISEFGFEASISTKRSQPPAE